MNAANKAFRLLPALFAVALAGCDSAPTDVEGEVEADAMELEPVDGIVAVVPVDEMARPYLSPPSRDDVSAADDFAQPMPEPGIACPDPDADDVTYLAEDAQECTFIQVTCAPGWMNLPKACGCGCFQDELTTGEAFASEMPELQTDHAYDAEIDEFLDPSAVIVEPPCLGSPMQTCGSPDDVAAE